MAGLEQFSGDLVNWIWATPLFFMLLACGLIFSVFSKFAQWRVLTHGYSCIAGHYDRPEDVGQINHFQALCAALSATIGLGNIAGVAVALSKGGPGAIFWMWVVGFFGMALKFVECTLAVMYRDERDVADPSAPALVEEDLESGALDYNSGGGGAVPRARGEVRGGPMWYIQRAIVDPLRQRGNVLWLLAKILAICFAISTMLNSFGGGNMFQGWNVKDMLQKNFNVDPYLSATVVSILVGMVIIGGIKRIGAVASRLVPTMCVIYMLGALYVIVANASEIPYYLGLIFKSAFTPVAESGACAGVSVWIAFQWGLKRACFSNEAGEGSAAMAHAAAKTDEPVREGVVAGIGPFIDTIIICTMSAMVLLMSGTWNRPAVGTITEVTETRAIVTCGESVSETIEPLYLQRIANGKQLSVHVVRSAEKELSTVEAPIREFSDTPVSAWSALSTLMLDLEDLDPETRAKLAPGQHVHLGMAGAELTSFAFDTAITGFGKYIVTIGVCLFAFSTMIAWSYYGEKGAEYLFGASAILPFKFAFVVFVFLGMVLPKFDVVVNFSDATTGMMVLCNLPAILILSPVVMRAARDYFRRLDNGEMPRLQ
ncbi:MAG: alanine/glycine:cation symporter family protein [Planctomycetota bacterium]|jgi:AGCS family alanine or glycine:cation symporter